MDDTSRRCDITIAQFEFYCCFIHLISPQLYYEQSLNACQVHAFATRSIRTAKTAASANLPIGTLDKSLSMWVFISPWASVTGTPAPTNGFTYA
jgi:hypothetical protein